MAREIYIAIEISDDRLAKAIQENVNRLTNVHSLPAFRSFGNNAPRTVPDIFILGEDSETADIFARLQELRERFPTTAIFWVSTNQNPTHIVKMMKAGVSEYLIPPFNLNSIQDAIEEVRTNSVQSSTATTSRMFSFISSKGGLGSTVIAVNTAAAMAARSSEKVALLDMSLQSGDSSTLLDIVPHTTIADLCTNHHRLDSSFLLGAMTRHATGIHFLPAPKDPEESADIEAGQVKSILDVAKNLFDTIIVDCTSMAINVHSLATFRASDKVFVLTDLSVPAIRNTSRLVELMQKKGIPLEKIEIGVTRFIKGKTLTLSEIEETLKKRVFWLFPNDFDCTISSINRGIPLVEYQPKTVLARNVVEFIEKLDNPANNQGYRGIKGLFRKTV